MPHPTPKPVRRCHACPLNLGERCWGHANPRGQWRRKRGCPSFGNERILELYLLGKKQATVKTRRAIRRELRHHLPPEPVYYLEPTLAPHLQILRQTVGL